MTLPFNVTLTHPWYGEDYNKTYTVGTYSFGGKTINEIVHERYSVPGTDYGCQQLQEAALIRIAKKVGNPANVAKLSALFGSLSKYLIATNMTQEDIVSAGLSAMSDLHPQKQIHYHQIMGTNELLYDDMLKAKNGEVVLDQEQLKNLIEKYFTNQYYIKP